MDTVFLQLLNMSLAASGLIVAVIVARFFLGNAPKWTLCLLWLLVAVRLVCPFSLKSDWSRIPSSVSDGSLLTDWTDNFVGEIYLIHDSSPDYEKALTAGLTPIEQPDGTCYIITGADKRSSPATVANTVLPVLAVIWTLGMVFLFLYAAVSYLRLYRTVQESILLRNNIYLCDAVKSPFILGMIRPRIFLPSDMEDTAVDAVIAHEKAHLCRLDHIWKPLGFLILILHWFNPLCWLAYALFCRDIEYACDERVIREMDFSQRKTYSHALVDLSTTPRIVTACPLAFGEIGVKGRIEHVLKFKKPAFYVIALAIIVCVFVGVSFLTNPTEGRAATPFLPGQDMEQRDNSIEAHYEYEAAKDPALNAQSQDFLEAAVSEAILIYNERKKGSGGNYDFACESHITLATETSYLPGRTDADSVTVYVIMLYDEFAYAGAGFGVIRDSLIPTVLTFDVTDNETYTLTEYWEPGNGNHYESDIREKFPAYAAEDAVNCNKYTLLLQQVNYAKAVDHSPEDVDTDFVIERFIDTIISKPAASSNPADYIRAHDAEYLQLCYFGDYTLRYCFGEFLKGGQNDLRGQIMRQLIDDLAPELAVAPAATGQEYFDSIKDVTWRTYQKNGAEWMQKNMPRGWMLVEMMEGK